MLKIESNFRDHRIIVSDILQSGFDSDGTKHMITIGNENAWKEYVNVQSFVFSLFKIIL